MNTVILLIIAIFVFRVLFKNFGFISEEELKKRDEAISKFLNAKNSAKNQDEENDFGHMKKVYSVKIDEPIESKTKKEKDDEEKFDETKFLKGAEKAVDMVMEAFNEKRIDVLSTLLDKKVFITFSKQINQSEANKENFKTVIVSFREKNVIDKSLSGRKKHFVTVKFVMDQINYVENENGDVILGSKDAIEKVSEIWKFTKNLKDNNIPWIVESIESIKE